MARQDFGFTPVWACVRRFSKDRRKLRVENSFSTSAACTNGANVKFHLVRSNEIWLPESDLDKISEGILVAESI